jgi:hypothetical protein
LARSNDPVWRDLARVIDRFYKDGAGRAVIAMDPEPKLADRLGFRNDRDYALYYPNTETMYFFIGFKDKASKAERVITILHEALHATTPIHNYEDKIHYDSWPEGSEPWAKYEAWLDNQAIMIAKWLKLIRSDYPETDWHRYLGRRR